MGLDGLSEVACQVFVHSLLYRSEREVTTVYVETVSVRPMTKEPADILGGMPRGVLLESLGQEQ